MQAANNTETLTDKVIRNVRGSLRYPHALTQLFDLDTFSTTPKPLRHYCMSEVWDNIAQYIRQNEGRIADVSITALPATHRGYFTVKVCGEIFGSRTCFQVEMLTPLGEHNLRLKKNSANV